MLAVTRACPWASNARCTDCPNLSHSRFHRNQRHDPAVAVAVGSQPQQRNVAPGHQRFQRHLGGAVMFLRNFDAGQPDLTPIRQLYGPAIEDTPHLRSAKNCWFARWLIGRLRRRCREQRDQSEADRHPMAQWSTPRTPCHDCTAVRSPRGRYLASVEWPASKMTPGTGCRRWSEFRLRGSRPPA